MLAVLILLRRKTEKSTNLKGEVVKLEQEVDQGRRQNTKEKVARLENRQKLNVQSMNENPVKDTRLIILN